MSNIESYFSGMANARSMSGGQYFKGEGTFLCELKRIFVNNGHKGKCVIAEFVVKESSSEQDPVGSTRSWVGPLEGERSRYTFSDLKSLIFALLGRNPKDCGQPEDNPALHQEATKIVMAACDPAYAKKNDVDPALLLDRDVRLETYSKPTRPKPGQTTGGLFTVHSWSPAVE